MAFTAQKLGKCLEASRFNVLFLRRNPTPSIQPENNAPSITIPYIHVCPTYAHLRPITATFIQGIKEPLHHSRYKGYALCFAYQLLPSL